MVGMGQIFHYYYEVKGFGGSGGGVSSILC